MARRNGLLGVGATEDLARLDLDLKTLLPMRRRPEEVERAIDEAVEDAREAAWHAVEQSLRRRQG